MGHPATIDHNTLAPDIECVVRCQKSDNFRDFHRVSPTTLSDPYRLWTLVNLTGAAVIEDYDAVVLSDVGIIFAFFKVDKRILMYFCTSCSRQEASCNTP